MKINSCSINLEITRHIIGGPNNFLEFDLTEMLFINPPKTENDKVMFDCDYIDISNVKMFGKPVDESLNKYNTLLREYLSQMNIDLDEVIDKAKFDSLELYLINNIGRSLHTYIGSTL